MHPPLVADGAGQILDADGEVVDVDLQPDRDDTIAELERLGRPADPARPLVLARLAEEIELDQLPDEARDRAAREAGLCRHPGPRTWLAPGDLLQHDPEIRPAHGRLIGARGRVVGALEAHARVLETGDVSVDSVNPAADFV